jgi:hypothetical protein
LPDRVAVPIDSKLEHDVGALADGPDTKNVTVPLGEDPPDTVTEIEEAEIAVPASSDDGAATDSDGLEKRDMSRSVTA